MKERDSFFFIGWPLALGILGFIWCLIGEILKSTSTTLHLISGILTLVCLIVSGVFFLLYKLNKNKIKDE